MSVSRVEVAGQISDLFECTGGILQNEKIVSPFHIFVPADVDQSQRDVHFYARLIRDPKLMLHIQGYPGFSDGSQAFIYPRLLNFKRVVAIRELARGSVGNEHDAFERHLTTIGFQTFIDYHPRYLADQIREGLI